MKMLDDLLETIKGKGYITQDQYGNDVVLVKSLVALIEKIKQAELKRIDKSIKQSRREFKAYMKKENANIKKLIKEGKSK